MALSTPHHPGANITAKSRKRDSGFIENTVPLCHFQPNKNHRTMEFELSPRSQTFWASVFMLFNFPLFMVLLFLSNCVSFIERLYSMPVCRNLYSLVYSDVSLTNGPIPGGAPLAKDPPLTEVYEFTAIKSPWYIFRILACTVLFFIRGGLTTSKVRTLNDTEFGHYIGHTMFSQYLEKEERDGELVYVLNLKEIEDLKTWNGLFSSASTTVFRRMDDGSLFPLSITLENQNTFTPSHGWKWKLAKLFVMNGLVYVTIHGRHPTLHFPWDCINLITKRIIPPTHNLSKLLNPHFRFSMVLNVNVLTEVTSASFYHWWKPYYAVEMPSEEIFERVMANGYKDWTFPMLPQLNTEFPYDFTLQQYYDCIRRFVSKVAPFIPRDDYVVRWGDDIAAQLPGFPRGAEIVDSESLLVDVLTMTIFSVGIHHNTDHYSFSHLDQRVLPYRIRVPPPTHSSSNETGFDEDEIMTRLDFFKVIT
ncbi:lipoxygenase [Paraphysoderma sedebokerense]|nr:lipoxygenase [Paraphysoderma sedebokerense]